MGEGDRHRRRGRRRKSSLGRWKSAPHPFAQPQLQSGHVCYGCCQVLFWGAARVENDLAGGRVCCCLRAWQYCTYEARFACASRN